MSASRATSIGCSSGRPPTNLRCPTPPIASSSLRRSSAESAIPRRSLGAEPEKRPYWRVAPMQHAVRQIFGYGRLHRFARRSHAILFGAAVLACFALAACGGSNQACHDQAVREAKAQTANFFAPLPAPSQAYRHGFYETSLKIALAKGCH